MTREYLDQLLNGISLEAESERSPLSLALLEIDQNNNVDDSFEDRLLRGVADTVAGLLSDSQTAVRFSDHQFMLLLSEEDPQHAIELTERMRQRIEATRYIADGEALQTTISCALAPMSADQRGARWLESLQETLDEAKRYGGNRTFLYDGISPAPVVPPELNVGPLTCEI